MNEKVGIVIATVALAFVATSTVPVVAGDMSAAPESSAPTTDASGVHLVRKHFDNVPRLQEVSLPCPAGEKALGGGARLAGHDRSSLHRSAPADGGGGWVASHTSPEAGSSATIIVDVICAKVT
ncbi:hypothetical protein [Allokutzneria oryzae]|uniref:Secreted protein n=1 Tax=Allokutzneria oryzae TaxID=1378989 RepID=A0ABV5ZTC6_9PSEU